MGRPLIVLFPGTGRTTRTEVGGKAASLIRMTEAGLPVPSGAVLTTMFFAPLRADDLEDAVRHCFASSLDVRVLTYKKEHGFDVWSPRIAAIVQWQIDSDVAGVGVSLNPLTNDYDEAVIEANWGLGTSVVEGQVRPDQFVVDKVKQRVVEETRGSKQVSVWLDADGGTVERKAHRSADRTLSDAQLRELTEVICRIEELYQTPIDIEWAYADGRLSTSCRNGPLPPTCRWSATTGCAAEEAITR